MSKILPPRYGFKLNLAGFSTNIKDESDIVLSYKIVLCNLGLVCFVNPANYSLIKKSWLSSHDLAQYVKLIRIHRGQNK